MNTAFSRKDNSKLLQKTSNYLKCTEFKFLLKIWLTISLATVFLSRKKKFKTMKLKRSKVHVSNNC